MQENRRSGDAINWKKVLHSPAAFSFFLCFPHCCHVFKVGCRCAFPNNKRGVHLYRRERKADFGVRRKLKQSSSAKKKERQRRFCLFFFCFFLKRCHRCHGSEWREQKRWCKRRMVAASPTCNAFFVPSTVVADNDKKCPLCHDTGQRKRAKGDTPFYFSDIAAPIITLLSFFSFFFLNQRQWWLRTKQKSLKPEC